MDAEDTYLQWVLGADGQDLVLEVAQLTAPGASLADPADEAGLVGAAHGAAAATRAQQLPLQEGQKTSAGPSSQTRRVNTMEHDAHQ